MLLSYLVAPLFFSKWNGYLWTNLLRIDVTAILQVEPDGLLAWGLLYISITSHSFLIGIVSITGTIVWNSLGGLLLLKAALRKAGIAQ